MAHETHELAAAGTGDKPAAAHSAENAAHVDADRETGVADNVDFEQSSSKLVRFYAHPWTQILLISFICFCLPGVRLQLSTAASLKMGHVVILVRGES